MDRFLQSLHQMKTFWMQMIDLDLFFWHLKGRCHGNQFCEKMAHFHFSQSGIQYGLQYRNFYFRILNRINFSTFLYDFGDSWSSNPRDCEGNNYTFLDKMAKSAYPTEYPNNC